MSFDFKKMKENHGKKQVTTALEMLCFGGGGDGKSSLAGTLDGKILYIHGESERHGPESAQMYCKGEIVALNIETYQNPNKDPDIALKTLYEVLGDIEGIKKEGYTSVVVDGLVELEAIARTSKKFKLLCLTKDNKHNSFEEGKAVILIIREVLSLLRGLADEGIHYYVTCALNVVSRDEEDGSTVECSPRMSTYAVAETIVLQFPDIIVIGEMFNEKGKKAHRIQFGSQMSKASKDLQGRMKRFINFKCRILKVDPLPENMKADLKEVIKMKKDARK